MKVFFDLVLLVSLCLTLVGLWFYKGLFFAGGEEGVPFYDLNRTIEFISFSWQDISAGLPIHVNLSRIPYFSFLYLFSNFKIPGNFLQAIHFFIIMSFGTLALYLLLYYTVLKEFKEKVFEKNLQYIPLIGAIFYLINPFSMTQIWGRGLYIQFFSFALFPFFLLMFVLALRYKNWVFGLLGLIISVLFAGAYGNPSYIMSQWLLLFIYLLYYIYRHRTKKEIIFSISYFIFLLVGWIFIQMWWIYPFIKTPLNQFTSALNNWEQNIGTLRGVSTDYTIDYILRLLHRGYVIRDQQYGQIYSVFPFTLLSFIIPVLAILSIRIFKKIRIFLFFGSLSLFSIFICIGSNPPSGWLFEMIFRYIPPIQSFRNPFEKFGLVLTIAYSPFFAIGSIVASKWICEKYKKTNFLLNLFFILFLVCGIYLWPMWTGQFAGGVKINPWVKVPEYYKQANNWLNQQKDDGRIIHFPINPGDGIRYLWEYPYQGREPSEYIFSKPAIGKNSQEIKIFYSLLLQRFNKFQPGAYGIDPDFTNSEFKSNELYEELAKLNVRYIILHKDLDPNLGNIGPFEPTIKSLQNERNIRKIKSFGMLDIYKVEIPEEIKLIYSPSTELTYKKVNPTFYEASVNTKEPFSLYFLENFDPYWEAYIDNKKVQNHNKVFSYANSWDIDKIGNYNIILKYKPQDYVEEGKLISKFSLMALTIMYFIYLTIKIWKKQRI